MLANEVRSYESYVFKITDEKFYKFLDDFSRSIDRLNQAFKVYGIPLNLDPTNALREFREEKELAVAAFAPVFDGKFKGILEPEHILTVASAVYNFFNCDDDLLMWGTYQVGKAMSFDTLFCLLPIANKLINDKLTIPVINSLSSNNVRGQTIKELDMLMAIYGEVLITHKTKKPIAWNYVKKSIRDNLFSASPGSGWDKFILNRNPSGLAKNKDLIAQTKDRLPGIDITFLKFCDEVQIGSARKSVHRDMDDIHHNLRSVYISATVGEVVASRRGVVVPVWIGSNYYGPIHYNGVKLPTIDPNHNKDIKYSKLSSLLGSNYQMYDERSCFKDYGTYKNFYPQGTQKTWKVWRRKFAEMIFEAFISNATEESPIVFIRPFDQVAPCKELIEMVNEILSECGKNESHKILNYSGPNLDKEIFKSGKEMKTIREVLVDEIIKPKRRGLVVCASGRAKAGDSFPPPCKVYVFFNENVPNWDGYWQVIHRAAGNYKQSEIFIPDGIYEQVVGAIKNGCRSTWRDLNRRTGWQTPKPAKKRGAPECQIHISLNSFHEHLTGVV